MINGRTFLQKLHIITLLFFHLSSQPDWSELFLYKMIMSNIPRAFAKSWRKLDPCFREEPGRRAPTESIRLESLDPVSPLNSEVRQCFRPHSVSNSRSPLQRYPTVFRHIFAADHVSRAMPPQRRSPSWANKPFEQLSYQQRGKRLMANNQAMMAWDVKPTR